jgi:hypothetical protein
MQIPPLHALEEFFGVTSVVHGDKADLSQSRITFDAELDSDRVRFEISPIYDRVHLRWVGEPFRVIDFRFANVRQLSIRHTAEDHRLVVTYLSPDVSECSVQLRPRIMIFWANYPESESHLSDTAAAERP